MSIYFRLNKEINTQKLLNKLQEEINNHSQNNRLEDSILCIEIRTISHICDETISKLEHTWEKLDD